MKKVMILVAAFAVVGLTSCKKDWTCECTTSDSSGTLDDVSASVTLTDLNKSDAETACSGNEVTVGTLSTTCELQ